MSKPIDATRPDPGASTAGVAREALSEARRRDLLGFLRDHEQTTVDELVAALAASAEPMPTPRGAAVAADPVEPHAVEAYLADLESKGLVRTDPDTGAVEADLSPEVTEWLDLAERDAERLAGDRPDDEGPIRVLLVDDQPDLPETIAAVVERTADDIEVTTAQSALEAITTLTEGSFDCVVSDYQMPAVDGLEFLEAIREAEESIPFILFTAKGSDETASRTAAIEATAYVQKRADSDRYDELVEAIRRAVGRA
jgi:CheY-like chemotaxis protein